MNASILTFLAAALFGCGMACARGGYSADRIQAFLTAGDPASAVRLALRWTRAEPNNDNAWESLGTAYETGLHRTNEAIPAFEYALAINPYSPQTYNALGEAYLAAKKYRVAAEAFEHACELSPLRSVYWNHLAAAYEALDRRDQALSALKKMKSSRRLMERG